MGFPQEPPETFLWRRFLLGPRLVAEMSRRRDIRGLSMSSLMRQLRRVGVKSLKDNLDHPEQPENLSFARSKEYSRGYVWRANRDISLSRTEKTLLKETVDGKYTNPRQWTKPRVLGITKMIREKKLIPEWEEYQEEYTATDTDRSEHSVYLGSDEEEGEPSTATSYSYRKQHNKPIKSCDVDIIHVDNRRKVQGQYGKLAIRKKIEWRTSSDITADKDQQLDDIYTESFEKLNGLSQNLQNMQNRYKDLQRTLDHLEGENEDLKEDQSRYLRENSSLNEDNVRLRSEVIHLKRKMKEASRSALPLDFESERKSRGFYRIAM